MYCTLNDILAELDRLVLIQLVNDESLAPESIDLNDLQSPARQRIDEQILNATVEIDGYLAGRYHVPLQPVPKLVQLICKDLAIYNLYKRRHRENMPESIVTIYRDRMKLLEQLQKGYVSLGVSEPEGELFCRTNKSKSDRIFPRDILEMM